ncbi:MAG: DUF4249 family protein [Bacteroidales bacterium]|nr:DUF4249 family protein [Bacteroidales bacterium]
MFRYLKDKYLPGTVLLVFLTMGMFSCELVKEVDAEFNYSTKRILVNGLLTKEKGVVVYVRSTVAPDSMGAPDYVYNPLVTLYQNGEPIEVLSESASLPGCYTSTASTVIDYNSNYAVGVEATGFEAVISENIHAVKPMKFFQSKVTMIDSIKRELYISTYFENTPDPDYFSLRIHRYVNGENQLFNPDYEGVYEAYSDEMYEDTISFTRKIDILRDSLGLVSYDSLVVELITISESYYRYLTSLSYYDESHLDPFNEYIIPVYSNIENGVGFFVSFSKTFHRVE